MNKETNADAQLPVVNRIFSYDVIRVVAILAVVMIHCSVSFVKSYNPPSIGFLAGNLFNSISAMAIQLFVMISGVFMLNRNKVLNIDNLVKKIIKLFMLFIIWAVVYASLYHSNKFLSGVFYGHYHLWFLFMLIGLYLITPILRLFVKPENKQYLYYFVVLSCIFQFIPVIIDLFLDQGDAAVKYSNMFYLDFVGGFVSYYILGWLIAEDWEKFKRYKTFICLAGVCSISIIFIGCELLTSSSCRAYKTLYSSLSFPMFVYSFSVFVFLKDFAEQIENRLALNFKNFVFRLAALSLGVYLIHPMVLESVKRNLLKNIFAVTPQNANPFVYILILFLITTVVSFIFTYLISKVPYLKKIVKLKN